MNATEKIAAISRLILSKVAAGMTLPEAVDAVLGVGRFAEIAGDVYDALRK